MKKHMLLILATFISSMALADLKVEKSKLSGNAKELPNGNIVISEPRIDGSCLYYPEDAGELACSMLGLPYVGSQHTWHKQSDPKACPSAVLTYDSESGSLYHVSANSDEMQIVATITCGKASDLRAD